MRDIDWRKNEINIIQQKTKNPVRLPLISVVGNAIIDFLKYGRPDFISYKLNDLPNPSVWLLKNFFKTPIAVWTLRTSSALRIGFEPIP